MDTIEQLFYELAAVGIALELLGGVDAQGDWQQGVRLRTFGKKLPKGRMVLAAGDTFQEAANEAVRKAKARRWEALAWDARPWQVRSPGPDEDAYGL